MRPSGDQMLTGSSLTLLVLASGLANGPSTGNLKGSLPVDAGETHAETPSLMIKWGEKSAIIEIPASEPRPWDQGPLLHPDRREMAPVREVSLSMEFDWFL